MNDVINQQEIGENKLILKVRCNSCCVDFFKVVEKGKNKELFYCEECR